MARTDTKTATATLGKGQGKGQGKRQEKATTRTGGGGDSGSLAMTAVTGSSTVSERELSATDLKPNIATLSEAFRRKLKQYTVDKANTGPLETVCESGCVRGGSKRKRRKKFVVRCCGAFDLVSVISS